MQRRPSAAKSKHRLHVSQTPDSTQPVQATTGRPQSEQLSIDSVSTWVPQPPAHAFAFAMVLTFLVRRLLRRFFDREGQEDQLGALGLVVNAIVLWNTLYMAAALDELSCVGYAVYPVTTLA